MKLFLKLAAVVLFLASPFSHAQIQKSLIGFQGTPWGSSIATVKAKFPSAKEFDTCKMFSSTKNNYEALKSEAKSSNSSCQYLKIEDYVIEGLKFSAAFNFDTQNKLTFVTLTYLRQQIESENYASECTAAYNRISVLLESRYGDYSNVNNLDDFGKDYERYSIKAWAPLPSEVWVANLSGDKFINKMATELNKPVLDVCKVKINYSRKVPSEAYKL